MSIPESVTIRIPNLYLSGCEVEVKFKTDEEDLLSLQKFGKLIGTAQRRGLPYYVIAHVLSENVEKRHCPYHRNYDAVEFAKFRKISPPGTLAYKDPSNRQKILEVHYLAIELLTAKGEMSTAYTFQPLLPEHASDVVQKAVDALDYGTVLEEEGKSALEETDMKILQEIAEKEVDFVNRYLLRDAVEAVKWYKAAAAQGNAQAQHSLGMRYLRGNGVEKNLVEAVRLYKAAAAQGNALGQCCLGQCYFAGHGVEKNLVEAVRLFKAAAAQGNAPAEWCLGRCYLAGGNGVEKDLVEAVRLIKAAAAQGNAPAQYDLGRCYLAGNGVEKNLVEAVRLFKATAAQGLPPAQYDLGQCYLAGNGVEKNLVEAVRLFKAAAAQGNAEAQAELKKLDSESKGKRRCDGSKEEEKVKAGDPDKKHKMDEEKKS